MKGIGFENEDEVIDEENDGGEHKLTWKEKRALKKAQKQNFKNCSGFPTRCLVARCNRMYLLSDIRLFSYHCSNFSEKFF